MSKPSRGAEWARTGRARVRNMTSRVNWTGRGEEALKTLPDDALVAYCHALERHCLAIARHLWFADPNEAIPGVMKFRAIGFDGDVNAVSDELASALKLMHRVHRAPFRPPPMTDGVIQLSPDDRQERWSRVLDLELSKDPRKERTDGR